MGPYAQPKIFLCLCSVIYRDNLIMSCGELLGLLLGIWQYFDIGLGYRSGFRQELILGQDSRSRLKMNTAEKCIIYIFTYGLVKTLNTVIMGPLFMLCSLTTQFMLCLFLDYFVYNLGLAILFVCIQNDIKADWKRINPLQPQNWLL